MQISHSYFLSAADDLIGNFQQISDPVRIRLKF